MRRAAGNQTGIDRPTDRQTKWRKAPGERERDALRKETDMERDAEMLRQEGRAGESQGAHTGAEERGESRRVVCAGACAWAGGSPGGGAGCSPGGRGTAG